MDETRTYKTTKSPRWHYATIFVIQGKCLF